MLSHLQLCLLLFITKIFITLLKLLNWALFSSPSLLSLSCYHSAAVPSPGTPIHFLLAWTSATFFQYSQLSFCGIHFWPLLGELRSQPGLIYLFLWQQALLLAQKFCCAVQSKSRHILAPAVCDCSTQKVTTLVCLLADISVCPSGKAQRGAHIFSNQ